MQRCGLAATWSRCVVGGARALRRVTLCSQNCCFPPLHLRTSARSHMHAPFCIWQGDRQTQQRLQPVVGGGGRGAGEVRVAHWDTSFHCLYMASKRNCNGAARHTVLITLFLQRRRVFTCTYAQTHTGCFEYHVGKKKDSGSTVYTPEYTVLKKLSSQLESTIVFFFLLRRVQ